jgi:catechol 2,3-dioxygenase-like lactoylglutathione lyase family enzyme
MTAVYLQHVQVNVPTARENDARRFYRDVIGLDEMPRPQSLSDAGRKGMWFRIGDDQELHVFLNPDDTPTPGSQHPALVVDDLAELRTRLEAQGCEIEDAIPIDGRARYFARDPGNNRLEFLEFTDGADRASSPSKRRAE